MRGVPAVFFVRAARHGEDAAAFGLGAGHQVLVAAKPGRDGLPIPQADLMPHPVHGLHVEVKLRGHHGAARAGRPLRSRASGPERH